MRFALSFAACTLLLAACGQSQESELQQAANQSDPTAAAVLNQAGQQGVDPQVALQEAGNAAAQNAAQGNSDTPRMQARPNSAQQPNPPAPGQPIEKVPVNSQ